MAGENVTFNFPSLYRGGGGGERGLGKSHFERILVMSQQNLADPPLRLCSILIYYSIVFCSILLYSVIDD